MSRRTRKGSIVGAFVAHPLDMRASHAWRALPDEARRILFRLELEHMLHGGACNGALTCTYTDFERDGIRRASISKAIRQCVGLGFLEITRAGQRSVSDHRQPSLYRLTYLNGRGDSPDPTHNWQHLASMEDALAALDGANAARRRHTQPKQKPVPPPHGNIDRRRTGASGL